MAVFDAQEVEGSDGRIYIVSLNEGGVEITIVSDGRSVSVQVDPEQVDDLVETLNEAK